jgi:hypothetical protein
MPNILSGFLAGEEISLFLDFTTSRGALESQFNDQGPLQRSHDGLPVEAVHARSYSLWFQFRDRIAVKLAGWGRRLTSGLTHA